MEIKRNYLYAAGLVLLLAALLYGGSHRNALLHSKPPVHLPALVRECQRSSARASYLAAYVRDNPGLDSKRAASLAGAIVSTIPTIKPDPTIADVDLVQNNRTGRFEYRLTDHAKAAQLSGCEEAIR